jgi:D-glycero-D-manno-heptose 1,7-bisphosphate phosphatase
MRDRRAVFLDRDGVINDNAAPVNSKEDFVLFPYAGRAIARLNRAGFLVFVVTNQGGVGAGYMTEQALLDIHARMFRELKKVGATIDDVRYCPHAPWVGCHCRKPSPAMILDLAERHQVNLARSYMVGDRESDMEAGKAAGVRTIFLGTGKTRADYRAANLREAVAMILQNRT